MSLDSQERHTTAAISRPSPAPVPTSQLSPTADGTHADEFAERSTSESQVGKIVERDQTTFGRYLILGKIKAGGMGIVYRAMDLALNREVALKTIRSGHDPRPEMVTRFLQEAQAVARLKHPNIIQIHDFGVVDDQHFFTMALADGASLAMKLADYQGNPRKAVALLERVARAIQHVHDNGILHRDLKPGNILLDRGEPLVSDFGLAKLIESDAELTRTGSALGTPAYMAPEQAAGRGDLIGPPTDVWGMGVILYELLCSAKPFRGDSREEMMRAIQHDELTELSTVRPTIDRFLQAILQKCLEKDPKHRYRSAGAFADDLGAWLRGEPIRAKPLGRIGMLIRAGRRHPMRLLGLCFLLTLPFAYAVVADRLDDDRELKHLESDMDQGQAVTLIGPASNPRWHQLPMRGEAIRAGTNRAFALKSAGFALCELLPKCKWKSYRYRAEVRHELSNIMGDCGIYIAHDVHLRGERDFHGFIVARFADAGQHLDQGMGTVDYRVFLHHQPAVGRYTRVMLQNRPGTKFPAAEPEQEPRWRRLALEVAPEEVRLSWEGKVVLKVPKEKVEALATVSQEWGPMMGAPANFSLARGLGLYVNSGVASFQNVVIEPLTQNGD